MGILGAEPLTFTRDPGGSRGSDGRYAEGLGPGVTPFEASVQPANGEDLQLLEEGLRKRDAKKLYTDTELQTASQHPPAHLADQVTIDGVEYDVMHVEGQRSVLPHFKAIVVRLKE